MRNLLVALLVMGCAGPAPTAPGDQADHCGAAARQDLLGQSADALPALPSGTRVLRPDEMITMDYSQTRLNIRIGADGLITLVNCG